MSLKHFLIRHLGLYDLHSFGFLHKVNILSELCRVITTQIAAPQDVKLTASNDDYYFVFEDFLYQVGVSRASKASGLK